MLPLMKMCQRVTVLTTRVFYITIHRSSITTHQSTTLPFDPAT